MEKGIRPRQNMIELEKMFQTCSTEIETKSVHFMSFFDLLTNEQRHTHLLISKYFGRYSWRLKMYESIEGVIFYQ